jgi:protein-S-isoprenylcysteine O-methyltransferase Ste14
MTPLPFSHSGARIAFSAVLGIWVALEWWARLRGRRSRQEGSRLDRGSLLVVSAAIAVGLIGGFTLARRVNWAAIGQARWLLFVAGLVLMAAGIALRQWAIAVLGRFFTVDVRLQPGQTVIDRGPYVWLRHPSYTGMIVTFLGIGLALGNWAALLVLAVVPTIGLVMRIHVEERALLEGLGEPYRRFAASRARLFPGIW